MYKDRIYRCVHCDKRDYGRYFSKPTVCKSCAAKLRRQRREMRRQENVPLELSADVVVTENVKERLEKKAEAEIPLSGVEGVANLVSFLLFPVLWISCPFVARIFFTGWSGALWLFIFGWALLLPTAGLYLNDLITAKPRQERREQVAERVLALAQKRQQIIEERKAFYSSPEWKLIRDQVIREEGRKCADCGKRIKDDADITVDHKQPRSKHPELALRRDNLRVLCRRCNSRKATRDWMEY